MAINPEIALGFRPPQLAPLPNIQSPLERYQKMLTLRHLMQQGQLGQMNIEQTQLENEALRRTAQDEQSLGSWMRQNQQRTDLTPQEIVASNPNPAGVKFATAWSAQQKANMEAQSAAITNRLNTLKAIDREMQGITDNATKAAALSNAVTNKWMTGEQAAPYLSMDVTDPKWKDFTTRIQSQTMDGTQRAEFAAAEIKARIARNTEASTTAGTIAEGDKKVLDAAQAQKASDAAMVAAAFDQSPQAGEAVLRTLAQDPKRFAPFKDVTTAAQARNVGLTAEQQAVGERAKTSADQQLWTDPGGLIAIMNDPNRSAADKQRAAAGLEKHEGLKRAGATTMMITPNQNIANEAKLRDDYRQDTKTYVTIRDAYNKIVGAAKSASAAGDIGLVYGFMRMQDPGSTVREGEFATAQNAGGIPERIRAMYNKAINGERLDPNVRADFVSQAEKIHSQSYADYQKTKDMYTGIAGRGGMDPQNVVIDYSTAAPGGQQKKGSESRGQKPATHRYNPQTKQIEEIR